MQKSCFDIRILADGRCILHFYFDPDEREFRSLQEALKYAEQASAAAAASTTQQKQSATPTDLRPIRLALLDRRFVESSPSPVDTREETDPGGSPPIASAA